MEVPVRLPNVGANHIVVSVWFAEIGDDVYAGDRLVEVLADSATFDVSAPATGRLSVKEVWPGDVVQVGDRLGSIEVPTDVGSQT